MEGNIEAIEAAPSGAALKQHFGLMDLR